MKLNNLPLLGVAAAGLVQVSIAAPLRILWAEEQSDAPLADIKSLRFGRPTSGFIQDYQIAPISVAPAPPMPSVHRVGIQVIPYLGADRPNVPNYALPPFSMYPPIPMPSGYSTPGQLRQAASQFIDDAKPTTRRPSCGKVKAFKAKALKISNAFRQAMGLPEIHSEWESTRPLPLPPLHHPQPWITVTEIREGVPIYRESRPMHFGSGKLPSLSAIAAASRPQPSGMPPHRHHHHRPGHAHGVHVRILDQPFAHRLHFALSTLGPWEGRAVAFVLGCGIGVLLRMLWVLTVIAYRTIRGSSSEDNEYQHIFEAEYDAEEIIVAPPSYVLDEKTPIVEEHAREEVTKQVEETK